MKRALYFLVSLVAAFGCACTPEPDSTEKLMNELVELQRKNARELAGETAETTLVFRRTIEERWRNGHRSFSADELDAQTLVEMKQLLGLEYRSQTAVEPEKK